MEDFQLFSSFFLCFFSHFCFFGFMIFRAEKRFFITKKEAKKKRNSLETKERIVGNSAIWFCLFCVLCRLSASSVLDSDPAHQSSSCCMLARPTMTSASALLSLLISLFPQSNHKLDSAFGMTKTQGEVLTLTKF
jgi:hypothetical protein